MSVAQTLLELQKLRTKPCKTVSGENKKLEGSSKQLQQSHLQSYTTANNPQQQSRVYNCHKRYTYVL